MSRSGETNRMRGSDTQVIGVQTYLRAMQGLAEHLRKAESQGDLDITIGVLILLAYIEVGEDRCKQDHAC